jgi:Calpain family cysteine protease
MPLRLKDSLVGSLYTKFETESKSTPNYKLGQAQLLQILAAVGDKSGVGGKTSASVLAELQKPGMTRDEQVKLVKSGMTAGEKKDLETILDSGTVPLDPAAKDFLNAVVGRTAPAPVGGEQSVKGLKVVGNQLNGLTGETKAGATIEAINITTAPAGRLHMDDTMVIGTADAAGKFNMAKLTGEQAPREGDLIRVRARFADGTTSDWMTVKAQGIEAKDGRNAVVALFRVGITDEGNGKVSVANINASRQVSEPGATLQFTNSRTGEKTKVVVMETGGFPDGFKLNGKAGDSFSLAASDGSNNTDFSTSVGNITVPGGTGTPDLIPDPALHKDELDAAGKPKFGKKTFTGPLFVDGPKPQDIQQGQIGDCYFPAAVAAIAQNHPEVLTNAIKDNGDGTYSVTFKQKDWATGKSKDVIVKVDGDLYARSSGSALYGHSSNSADSTKMELWFPLLEKAYAQWKGSYNSIGDGGQVSDVVQDIMGVDMSSTDTSGSSADSLWKNIKTSIDAKKPVGAGTYGDDKEALYTNTGVYADHAYSILGYKEVNGQRLVTLRNPWGESEPAGNGANDGIFDMKIDDFKKLYQTLYF